MPSDEENDLQTRRRRALLVAGAIGVAAIAWNANDWWGGGDDHVRIEVNDDDIAERIREEVRESVRESGDQAREAREAARAARDDEELPRISEEDGVLRIEGPDGRTVTISTDGDSAADAAEEPVEEEATAESSG